MGSQAVSLVSQQDKGLAYGTAVMAAIFDPEIDSISYKSQNTEISAVTRKLSGYILTVIGGYRSPSLRLDETRRWYAELEELVQTRQRARDDVIIVAMDDNASDKSGFAFRELERMRRACGGNHVIQEPTRRGRQPDHTVAFYDPLRFTVTGFVLPGVGDHDAMIIDVEHTSVMKIEQKWNNKRTVLYNTGTPEVIDLELENEFYTYTDLEFENCAELGDFALLVKNM